MKLKNKLSPLVLATSVAISGMAVPMVSQADLSASFAASSMYLWRGQNLSPDGGAISGSLDYSNGGFYAGMWTSSENGGAETDLYLGFSGEASGVSYDIGYAEYMYPEDGGPGVSISDSDASEAYLSLGYGGFGFSYYMQTDSDLDDDAYMTLSYGMDAWSVTYGTWMLEDDDADSYSHVTFDYAATDELSFAVSKAVSVDNDVVESDPLFAVTWSKSFDL